MHRNHRNASLSVVIVVGDCTDRVDRILAKLAMQSVADQMEIIMLDAAEDRTPKLHIPSELEVRCIKVDRSMVLGKARFEGTRCAKAPIVAYLEDHCYPLPGWAEALIESHQGPWTAVGYSFTNASPDTYLNRSTFFAEYGHWIDPTPGGPTDRLPGVNTSYKRETLLSLGDPLAELLEFDFNLHETLRKRGHQFYIEPRARVTHECYASFLRLLYIHFCFCRLQAVKRAEANCWDHRMRLAAGLIAPFALPLLQLLRTVRSFRNHNRLSKLLLYIPTIYIIYQSDALGESLGHLIGAGESFHTFALRDLNSARAEGDMNCSTT